MKPATIFILIIILNFQFNLLSGQSFTEPTPVMNKKLLKDFLHAHLVYPEGAKENKEEGKVIIKYTIDKTGKVIEREVLKSVSEDIDSAALHLFDLIEWQPALAYGIAIESEGGFEIQYDLKKYAKYVKARGYELIQYTDHNSDNSYQIYDVSQLTKQPIPIITEKYGTLEAFILNEMKYPEEAQRLGIKGKVKLSFIVELNGIPSNIQVIETLGGGCCEESIRILQIIKWIPGIKDNMYVRTNYELVIHFNPADNPTHHIPSQSNSGL